MATKTKDTSPVPETSDSGATTNDAQAAAEYLALQQTHGEAKSWGPFKKETTEIPKRLIGTTFTLYQPKAGATSEETWENILVFCGGDHVAALDTFVSAQRLSRQKDMKAGFKDTVDKDGKVTAKALDIPTLQEVGNRHVCTRTVRGKGGAAGTAKARAERAEAKASLATASMEEMLADLAAVDPEKAEAYRQKLAALQS